MIGLAGEGENLCLAGGLFLNVLLVESLERCGRWKNVFVQPAAGNAGTAIGAVYHVWHQVRRHQRRIASAARCFSGPARTRKRSSRCSRTASCDSSTCVRRTRCLTMAVRMLGDHKIVAWMHGRMEFGPRALGNRSILASPLDPYSTENLNVFIKHREPFRKFAASVPAEAAAEYFEAGSNARNLATVGRVRPEHRKTFEAAILGEDMIRAHVVPRRTIRSITACCTKPGRRRGCRCSTTPASTCSAIRWSRRLATQCGVFIPRASTRCSWGISCWRNNRST